MNTGLLVLLALFLSIGLILWMASPLVRKWLIVFGGAFIALFSVFGFLHSFEGSDTTALVFRAGYAVFFILAITAIVFALRRRPAGSEK